MVDLMNLLSDVLIGSFQMLMLNDLGKNMFPYRIKTCWTRILIYGVTALVILGVNHIESTFINIMMVPVSYTIASIVIFQGSVWKKIILTCCYYMLAIVPEFLFAVITGAYGVTGTENNFHSELEKLLSLLLMSTITFLLVKCVNQITRKKNYQTIENKLFTVLLTLPAATIIIFMCIYYSQISYTGVNRIMIPIGAALLLMTNICIFAVFDKLIEKSEEVKKMELLYQKSKAENINQKYINKVNEDKRVFLHDVNKFLCTAASLIENGKNLELDSMVRHLGIRMEELKNYSYCADPVLNSILCERKFVAESKGILYKIKLGNNLRTDFIEDLDLISIVGNLLDNAIEAAEKTEKDQHVMHYQTLDIDEAFSSQLPSNFQADIVIAVGVLNNSVNTDKCIYEINSVMKPGGILLIIETVEDVPDILITQSFMMTEPKDQRKATNTMFLNRKQWLEILEENGFCNSEEFPGYGEYLEVLGQKLFYCTKE